MAEKKEEIRFILLGTTAVGKSATGNFILKKEAFESKMAFNSVTKAIAVSTSVMGHENIDITVVDTPGLFDNRRPMLQIAMEIQQSLDFVNPGPHAFLLVIKCGVFTCENEQALGFLRIMFGKNLMNYTIIIFTHEDQCGASNVKNMINENMTIKDLLRECGDRYLTLNNREERDTEINTKLESLLRIAKTVSNNGKRYYAENINIYRKVLQNHVKMWTETRLTGEQIKTILQEQENERRKQMLHTGAKAAAGAGALFATGVGLYSVLPAGTAVERFISGAVTTVTMIGNILRNA